MPRSPSEDGIAAAESSGSGEGGVSVSGSGLRGLGFRGAHNNRHHHHGGLHSSDVSFRTLFQDFNAPKFLVCNCLLVFCVLFALRLDGSLS